MNILISKKTLLTLAVFFILIGSFFTAKVPFDSSLQPVASSMVILLALPSFYFLAQKTGLLKAVAILCIMGLYAFGVEYFAVSSGLPYGHFEYSSKIALKLFDVVPWTVPFAWFPLILGVFSFLQRKTSSRLLLGMYCGFLLTLVDLVLDPGAVSLQFWHWSSSGLYYGVPFINYIGWFISGTIGGYILIVLLEILSYKNKVPRFSASSLLLILYFWTGVAFWKEMLFPFCMGVVLIVIFTIFLLGNAKTHRTTGH